MSDATFGEWSAGVLARTEAALEALLPPVGDSSLPPVGDGGRPPAVDSGRAPAAGAGALGRLHEAMRYAVLGGGKRVRPLLVHAAGELTGAPAGALDAAGCAVELIHAYSLVHDDLPCMDDDVLRRGKPTVHVAYGEALAMLTGDALQALAFRAVAETAVRGVPPAASVRMAAELADAAGSLGMAGGQAIDLAAVGGSLDRAALEDMHRRKTGAMLRASVRLGAWCGEPLGADAAAALDDYCAAVGLAFQVVDDVLDVEADSATLGKTAGKDAANDKPTFVSLLGLEPARALAAALRARAHRSLEGFGTRAGRLAALADLIVDRRS